MFWPSTIRERCKLWFHEREHLRGERTREAIRIGFGAGGVGGNRPVKAIACKENERRRAVQRNIGAASAPQGSADAVVARTGFAAHPMIHDKTHTSLHTPGCSSF